jgi:hypothetical protein
MEELAKLEEDRRRGRLSGSVRKQELSLRGILLFSAFFPNPERNYCASREYHV